MEVAMAPETPVLPDDATEQMAGRILDHMGIEAPTKSDIEQAFELVAGAQERPWHLMDNAPQDGTMIEVKEDPDQPDETAMMVRYYHTSVRDREKRKWVPAAWWRTAITAEKLMFEPFCWRMPQGFEAPGMIVA